MLRLERHLTEDELLALRDGRDDDFVRVSHRRGARAARSGWAS